MPTTSEHDKSEQGFEDSRRLTGPNLYLPGCGIALEVLGGKIPQDAILNDWKRHVVQTFSYLQWQFPEIVIRKHKTGASLAFSAPADQLYSATEVNEWAWLMAADCEQEYYSPGAPSLTD